MEGKEIPRQCAWRRRILLLLLLLVFHLSFSRVFFSTGIDSRRRIIRYRYRNPICKRHTQGLVTLIGDHARRLTMVVGDTRWPADNGSPCTDADRIAGSVERIRCHGTLFQRACLQPLQFHRWNTVHKPPCFSAFLIGEELSRISSSFRLLLRFLSNFSRSIRLS